MNVKQITLHALHTLFVEWPRRHSGHPWFPLAVTGYFVIALLLGVFAPTLLLGKILFTLGVVWVVITLLGSLMNHPRYQAKVEDLALSEEAERWMQDAVVPRAGGFELTLFAPEAQDVEVRLHEDFTRMLTEIRAALKANYYSLTICVNPEPNRDICEGEHLAAIAICDTFNPPLTWKEAQAVRG